ncbi:hypothetical protein, partial [uncultured Parabacteroides sp.]|uniref:hypothetical protein n=1 Tax=uncultured Parabacteroides sp. TaxID=512312 RepID=UPI002627BA9A
MAYIQVFIRVVPFVFALPGKPSNRLPVNCLYPHVGVRYAMSLYPVSPAGRGSGGMTWLTYINITSQVPRKNLKNKSGNVWSLCFIAL